jgi:hypothetical protein
MPNARKLPSSPESPARAGLALVAFAFVLVVVVNIAGLRGWNAILLDGRLPDADSYLRLLRILDLREGAGWYDDVTARLGAPDGLLIQWTRPFDILMFPPALVLERVAGLGPRDALLAVGLVVSPLLLVAAAAAAGWAARAIWPGTAPVFAVLLMVGTPAAATFSSAGRSDHHALMLLALTLGIGAALHALTPGGTARAAAGSGAALGLALWVGPEAIIIIAPIMSAIGLASVLADDGRQPAAQGLRLSLGFAGVLALAILVEHRPDEWLRVEYDRVTIHQLCVALSAGGVFTVANWVGAQPRPRRALAAGTVALAALALLVAVFPDMARGPLANADPAYLALLHETIQENRPVPPFVPGSLWEIAELIGLVCVLGLLAVGLAMPGWIRDGRWPAGLMLGLTLLAGIGATFAARRFGLDLAPAAAIAASGAVGLILDMRWPRGEAARGVLAALLLFGALGLPFVMLLDPHAAAGSKGHDAGTGCDWTALARWLATERPEVQEGEAPPILMASDLFTGPELAWRTPYRIVAAPHHRGGPAIADTIGVMQARDPATAQALLAHRGVALLAACTAPVDGDVAEGTLAAAIRDDAGPDWLRPVSLPAALSRFRLFVVAPPQG